MAYTPDILIKQWLIVNATPESKIVDVGCGDGRLIKQLVECGYRNAIGTDVLVHSIDREIDASMLAKKFPFLLASERLPFDDLSIDFIVCNQVFEHVEDKHSSLLDLRRTLKDKGRAILVFPTNEAFVEHHVKLPRFHAVQLTSPIIRLFYRILVVLGLGAFPDWRGRMAWLNKEFREYGLGHFYISRSDAIDIATEAGFPVEVLDREYIAALELKFPWLIRIVKRIGCSNLLLQQIGVALVLTKA